jgi:hypothetical protein
LGSVETAATRAVEKPPLDVAERFVGGVEQTSQIIALALVFLCQGYFRVVTWRIDEARSALELLFAGSCCSMRVVDTHASRLILLSLLLTHTAVNFGLLNAAIPRPP